MIASPWRYAKNPKEMLISDRRSRNAEKRMNIELRKVRPIIPLLILIGGLHACAIDRASGQCSFWSGCPGDAKITATVREQLVQNPSTATDVIYVSTYNGVVYLNGAVDSLGDSQTAERIARETPGVRNVISSFGSNP
jgi:hypothetical protein